MKRRFLSILLALCMVLVLLPALALPVAAAAVTGDYMLYLNDTNGRLYEGSSTATDITDQMAANGATVDGIAGAWILKLSNFSFETSAYTALRLPAGTTIELVGNNTITCTYNGESVTNGIYSPNAIAFCGTGTLSATGGTSTVSESLGIRADAGEFKVSDSVTITAKGGSSGTVSTGIYAYDLTISGSATVSATGGTAGTTSYGIRAGNGTTTISGSTTVTATGGTAAEYSYGIYSGSIIVSDSAALSGTGGAATANNSIGIRTNSSFMIGGSADITATVGTSGSSNYGIYIHTGGNLGIAGNATVAANCGASGNNSYGIFIATDGSMDVVDDATVSAMSGTAVNMNEGIFIGGGGYLGIGGNATVTAGCDTAGSISYGIHLSDNSNLVIRHNAELTATSGTATGSSSYGLRAENMSIYENATVTATGGTSVAGSSYGLRVVSGTVSGDAAVTATGGTAESFSHGAYVDNLTVSGTATIDATGGTAKSGSYGISKPDGGELRINSGATVTAASGTAPASCYGIHTVNGGLTINGGTFIATGSSRALYPNYTVPGGYTYYVNTAAAPSTTPLTGDDSAAIIDGNYKYAKVEPSPFTDMPFIDVKAGDWFYSAVKYAYDNSLMNGISYTLFAPDNNLTRAMLVTILHRYEGEPVAKSDSPFTDVQYGQWHANAVTWASENSIVSGYGDGRFGPDDNITREQVALILYRYAKWKKFDVSKTNSLTSYTDRTEVSDWALDAMKWANAEGLISGRTPTTLVPGGTMSRAEVATVLMRFIEDFVN